LQLQIISTERRSPTRREIIEHIFPRSFFESAAGNDVLQVVVFAILFAVALTQIAGKPKETTLNFFEGLSEGKFKLTGIVMKFAPFGAGADGFISALVADSMDGSDDVVVVAP